MSDRVFRLFLPVAVFLLAACLPTAPSPTLPPTVPVPTRAPVPTRTPAPPPSAQPTVTPRPSARPTPPPRIEHVLLISVDGLSPQALAAAATPHMDRLWQNGAYSWRAQTILPSVTLPSHAAMLTGLPPEVTGVTYNDWSRGDPYISFPTVLSLAHEAGLSTAAFIGKGKLGALFPPGSVDHLALTANDAQSALDAAAYLARDHPALLFVHFVAVDAAGHAFGWGSEQQLRAVELVDQAVGQLLAALDRAGLAGNTAVLLNSDHGGHGVAHGSDRPADTTIVWMLYGPGVVAGKELATPVHIYDTAATVAYALGLAIPPAWQGRPVLEAFVAPPHLLAALLPVSQASRFTHHASRFTRVPLPSPSSPRPCPFLVERRPPDEIPSLPALLRPAGRGRRVLPARPDVGHAGHLRQLRPGADPAGRPAG